MAATPVALKSDYSNIVDAFRTSDKIWSDKVFEISEKQIAAIVEKSKSQDGICQIEAIKRVFTEYDVKAFTDLEGKDARGKKISGTRTYAFIYTIAASLAEYALSIEDEKVKEDIFREVSILHEAFHMPVSLSNVSNLSTTFLDPKSSVFIRLIGIIDKLIKNERGIYLTPELSKLLTSIFLCVRCIDFGVYGLSGSNSFYVWPGYRATVLTSLSEIDRCHKDLLAGKENLEERRRREEKEKQAEEKVKQEEKEKQEEKTKQEEIARQEEKTRQDEIEKQEKIARREEKKEEEKQSSLESKNDLEVLFEQAMLLIEDEREKDKTSSVKEIILKKIQEINEIEEGSDAILKALDCINSIQKQISTVSELIDSDVLIAIEKNICDKVCPGYEVGTLASCIELLNKFNSKDFLESIVQEMERQSSEESGSEKSKTEDETAFSGNDSDDKIESEKEERDVFQKSIKTMEVQDCEESNSESETAFLESNSGDKACGENEDGKNTLPASQMSFFLPVKEEPRREEIKCEDPRKKRIKDFMDQLPAEKRWTRFTYNDCVEELRALHQDFQKDGEVKYIDGFIESVRTLIQQKINSSKGPSEKLLKDLLADFNVAAGIEKISQRSLIFS